MCSYELCRVELVLSCEMCSELCSYEMSCVVCRVELCIHEMSR